MYFVIGSDGQRYGPVDDAVLSGWISERRLSPEALSLKEGEAAWTPLGHRPEFRNGATPSLDLPDCHCIFCGSLNPSDGRFCCTCGKAMESLTAVQPHAPPMVPPLPRVPPPPTTPSPLSPRTSTRPTTDPGAQIAALISKWPGWVKGAGIFVGGLFLLLVLSQFGGSLSSSGGGFDAVIECKAMGQSMPLMACVMTSSITVTTSTGVREYNGYQLDTSSLHLSLPEHFQVTASNSANNDLPVLTLVVRNKAGSVVHSDSASQGRSIRLRN